MEISFSRFDAPSQISHSGQTSPPTPSKSQTLAPHIESVLPKFLKGQTIFILTLSRVRSSPRSSSIEIDFNGYSADQIADLRARLLLLNETPSIHEKNHLSQKIGRAVQQG